MAAAPTARAALGHLVYGRDDETLQEVVGQMLIDRMPGKTVSTAQTTAGDATPPDTDAGSWAQQNAPSESPGAATPGTATTSSNDPALDTATASPNDQPQTASGGIGSDSEDPRNPAS